MTTSALLSASHRFHVLSSATSVTARRSPIYSVRPLIPCCGPYAGGSSDCFGRFFIAGLAFTRFVKVRQPRLSTHRTTRGRSHDAATFALCYGPEPCLPRSGRDVYCRACRRLGHPNRPSTMTARAFASPVTGLSPAGLTALWAAHKTERKGRGVSKSNVVYQPLTTTKTERRSVFRHASINHQLNEPALPAHVRSDFRGTG